MKTSDANYGNKKTGESIPSLNLAPFGRWTALKRRRLALLQGLPKPASTNLNFYRIVFS
jgi:hypothetical protein